MTRLRLGMKPFWTTRKALKRECQVKVNEVEGLHRELASREEENIILRRENSRAVCAHMDQRETLEIKNAVLEDQMMVLLTRLRMMRNSVEQFRETLMQADHGQVIEIPQTNVEELRRQMGLPLDGSAVQWGKQSPTKYNIEHPKVRP